MMTKDLRRLLVYFLYLLTIWGGVRFFVRLPDVIVELWFKPIIWLVPLYWWRFPLRGKPVIFNGKLRPALIWGLVGGLIYFVVLQLLANRDVLLEINQIGIAGATAIVEELVFSGMVLTLLIKETKNEGRSLALTALAYAIIHIPSQVFVFSLTPTLLLAAFSLTFFVGLINGFLRLRSDNVLSAILAHFFFLVLAL